MIEQIIIGLVGIVLVWVIYLYKKISSLNLEIKKAESEIKSVQVRFGKTFEKFVPFITDFPVDREKFVFLGMPIDGIAFEDDKITFIEIKTGCSQLSTKQRNIRDIVRNKQVFFKEVRYGEEKRKD